MAQKGDKYFSGMRPKKSLGQHFLIAPDVARRMVEALHTQGPKPVLEVGPGKGAVTTFLVGNDWSLSVVDLDKHMCAHITERFPELQGSVYNEDFLEMDLDKIADRFQLIGSFPYNISSQILFRVIECREQIPVVVGMFQKEVAERIVSSNGTKAYGILSVLTQTFYTAELLFTVKPGSFNPPPKVDSAVVRLCLRPGVQVHDEPFFFQVVKAAFNQRRKMLRNSLHPFLADDDVQEAVTKFLNKRPEQLSVGEFQELAGLLKGQP